MMTKTLVLVSMLVGCHCLPQMLDSSQLDAIFGPKPADSETNQDNQKQVSTTDNKVVDKAVIDAIFGLDESSTQGKRIARADDKAPTSTSAPAKMEECTMNDGQPGKCIHYYLCQDKVENLSVGLLDSRTETAYCTSYIDICCSEKGIVPVSKVL